MLRWLAIACATLSLAVGSAAYAADNAQSAGALPIGVDKAAEPVAGKRATPTPADGCLLVNSVYNTTLVDHSNSASSCAVLEQGTAYNPGWNTTEAEFTEDAQFPGPGPGPGGSMFQRFAAGRDATRSWQLMFEAPVALYPQTNGGAHTLVNTGLNWVTSYQPLNRYYFGRSIGYAHMEWRPGGDIDTIEVVQWDWTEIFAVAVRPWWVVSFGLGLGFMDGLIFLKNGSFVHRLEIFVPVQVGTGFRLGKSWFVGAKAVQSSYFGPGPVASVARIMIGVGYNY
jgi:hypothetical protein